MNEYRTVTACVRHRIHTNFWSDEVGKHLLVNGLSITGGGGFTVGLELSRNIAAARPDWTVTLAFSDGHHFKPELEAAEVPPNLDVQYAPSETLSIRPRLAYERGPLSEFVNHGGDVDGVLQLNAQVVPTFRKPSLAHYQDPMPYRSIARPSGLRNAIRPFLKRRALGASLKRAAVCGWTSEYLRDLITSFHGYSPKKSVVFYNGIPQDWIDAVDRGLPDWESRPMELLSLSNVAGYKRQSLVIQSLPGLIDRPETVDIVYRIVGACPDEQRASLTALAESLGVGERVIIEGRVSVERVQEVLRTSRAFTLMSLCESFGIPAIEAMRYGTPPVVSDCCAHPEVCRDAALLVPIDDIQALTDSLHAALSDRETADRLRQAGVENIKRFSWVSIAERMVGELEQMMDAGLPAG